MGSFHNWHASPLRKMLLISCNCFIWSHVEVNSRFTRSVSRWTVLLFFFFSEHFLTYIVHSLGLSKICAKLFKRFSRSNKSDWISIPISKWKLHDLINFTCVRLMAEFSWNRHLYPSALTTIPLNFDHIFRQINHL